MCLWAKDQKKVQNYCTGQGFFNVSNKTKKERLEERLKVVFAVILLILPLFLKKNWQCGTGGGAEYIVLSRGCHGKSGMKEHGRSKGER